MAFTGRVPHGEVSRYYDQIDLLAYPRHSMRLTELVTPLKPLEAMAQGRIFVASDVGPPGVDPGRGNRPAIPRRRPGSPGRGHPGDAGVPQRLGGNTPGRPGFRGKRA